jgi:hypothetical protein
MRPLSQRLRLVGAVACLTMLAGCPEEFGPLDPTIENTVDPVILWAISGTDVYHVAGYDVKSRSAVRIQTAAFDFAFDLAAGNEARLYPTDALQLTGLSGLQLTTTPFEEVTVAPTSGYEDSSAVVVTTGSVVLVRSRPDNCFIGTMPYYAKLRVAAIDVVERRIELEVLADVNCGYRGLEPGLPLR